MCKKLGMTHNLHDTHCIQAWVTGDPETGAWREPEYLLNKTFLLFPLRSRIFVILKSLHFIHLFLGITSASWSLYTKRQ